MENFFTPLSTEMSTYAVLTALAIGAMHGAFMAWLEHRTEQAGP
jgi:hypothetical protein